MGGGSRRGSRCGSREYAQSSGEGRSKILVAGGACRRPAKRSHALHWLPASAPQTHIHSPAGARAPPDRTCQAAATSSTAQAADDEAHSGVRGHGRGPTDLVAGTPRPRRGNSARWKKLKHRARRERQQSESDFEDMATRRTWVHHLLSRMLSCWRPSRGCRVPSGCGRIAWQRVRPAFLPKRRRACAVCAARLLGCREQ